MQPFGITVDGIRYNVHVEYGSIKRAFGFVEGNNAGMMLTGRDTRDILGTGYSYSMTFEQDPAHADDYDALYEVLSAPVDSHSVTLPYGQRTLSFQAKIEGGEDSYGGKIGGVERWKSLTIQFQPIEPQRR